MFFSFDGIDGVGKTTQVGMLCDALAGEGWEFVVCRDPGSTSLGERVRELLLSSDASTPIGSRSEMLLYMAARAQLVEELILPARESGRIVIADRYLLANVVYQGHAGGLDPELIWQVGRVATQDVLPDRVFLLDMPPEAADRRLNRPLDRMESRGGEYRKRLRDGFLLEARRDPHRIEIIDASAPAEDVHSRIWGIARTLIAGA